MIVLASASPRRKELLAQLVNSFLIDPADIDESEGFLSPDRLSYDLARMKAYEVYKRHPNDLILSADTIVVLNDKVFGKPRDKDEAREMLNLLSGKKHVVLTGFCLFSSRFEINGTIKTDVYFNNLSHADIETYVDSLSPLDKAGAYGIQDEEYHIVNHIEGSLSNVIGLPLERISYHLNKIREEFPELFL